MDFTGLFPLAEDELDSPEFLTAISLSALIAGTEEQQITGMQLRRAVAPQCKKG
jgi:hypothetical protein